MPFDETTPGSSGEELDHHLNNESSLGETAIAGEVKKLKPEEIMVGQYEQASAKTVSLAKQLDTESAAHRGQGEVLDAKSPLDRLLNPANLARRAWWKKEGKELNEKRAMHRELVSKHIEKIQEEAEFYAAAYEDYIRMQEELGEALGIEPVIQNIDGFMMDIENEPNSVSNRYDYTNNQYLTMPDGQFIQHSDDEMEERYKYYGRQVAIEDILMPHLLARETLGYSEAPNSDGYKINPAGVRYPRLELFVDEETAQKAMQDGSAVGVLVLEIKTGAVLGDNEATKRYLPLSPEAAGLIGPHITLDTVFWWTIGEENDTFFRATAHEVSLSEQLKEGLEWNESAWDKIPKPWFAGKRKKTEATLKYHYTDPQTGKSVTEMSNIRAYDEDEARKRAVHEASIGEEIGEKVVRIGGMPRLVPERADRRPQTVILDDGTEIPYEEFVKPVIGRREDS